MTRAEYDAKLRKYMERQWLTGDACGWFQSKIDDLNAEYIAFLEMYLKNVQAQCVAQDEVIKRAEESLGNGFWQRPRPSDPIFEGCQHKETEWEKGFAAGYEEGFNNANK